MSDQPPRKSLKDEIEKRKTQEILRKIEENKRASQTMSPVPRKTGPLTTPDKPTQKGTGPLAEPGPSSPANPLAQPKGTGPLTERKQTGPLVPPSQPTPAQPKGTRPLTERKQSGSLNPPKPKGTGALAESLAQRKKTGPLVPPTPQTRGTGPLSAPVPTPKPRDTGPLAPRTPDDVSRIRQTLTTEAVQRRLRSRPFQIAIAAGVLIIVVSMATFFVAGGISQPPLPTPIQLPTVRALEAVNYLKRVGLPVGNIKAFSVPNNTWNANEEIQFEITEGSNQGTFVVLSYGSSGALAFDAVTRLSSGTFKTWSSTSISNLLVLATAESAAPVRDEVIRDLTQYLIAPMALLPTTTLQVPSSTPGQLPPPATAIPTTPAPPTASSGVAAAGGSGATLPPTLTEAPTETPTSTPVPPTIVPSPTKPVPIVTNTPGATDEPSYTPLPPEAQTLLPPPTVTASGPIIPPGETITQLYVDHAPQTVGPFNLQNYATHTDRFSATMLYQSDSGEQFRVVVLVTFSPQDSLTRYNAEISTIPNAQQIPIGEQGVMGPPDSPILAETRFRNVVIVIYRLQQTTGIPVTPPQPQEVVNLLKALYDVLP